MGRDLNRRFPDRLVRERVASCACSPAFRVPEGMASETGRQAPGSETRFDDSPELYGNVRVGNTSTWLRFASVSSLALLGTSKGQYTFMGHLKWTPVIALGYFASIGAYFLVNG